MILTNERATKDWGTTSDGGAFQSIPLGAHLVAAGLATEEDIQSALDEQRRTGGRLGEILVAQGVLFEDDLARTMAELSGIPFRDLTLDPANPTVSDYIPEAFCRRRGVLPVDLADGALTVAISDPRDLQTFDDLRTLIALPIIPVMATKGDIRRSIDSVYSSHLLDDADQEGAPEGDPAAQGPFDDVADAAAIHRNEGPVIEFVNQVLRRAVAERASDIHIEPTADGLRIRFRVDGMLRDAMSAPASFRLAVISRIKIMAELDISEHRRPQDGRMSIRISGRPVDIRAASIPTINGEAIVLRVLVRDTGLLQMDALGFRPGPMKLFSGAIRKAWGMILVTGPTGSGKSTTLYAAINELNSPSRNTVTVEDPIEYRVAGIKQTQVNAKAGYTFVSGLRAALRTDPDVILVGEIRDLETARIASEAALTGHLVLSTLHANDAASSTTRLLDMGLRPYQVTSTLECVVAQRLIRRLCPRCKSVSDATPEEMLELTEMGLIQDAAARVPLHRANSCEQCGRTGYLGRIAVQEVMVMDEALRTLVLQHSPAEAVAATAVAGGMQTLKMDAYAKLQDGETTFDEVKRLVD